MKLLHLAIVVLFAGLICQCKKNNGAEDNGPGMVEVRSTARYGVLEDLEAEDSFVGSELSEADIEREVDVRSGDLKKRFDINGDDILAGEELQQVKNHFKDKMLEKFDVDSDGSFSEPEAEAILDQIRIRLDEFHQRHPESFSDKRTVICKVVTQRSGHGPLLQNILEKCQG